MGVTTPAALIRTPAARGHAVRGDGAAHDVREDAHELLALVLVRALDRALARACARQEARLC